MMFIASIVCTSSEMMEGDHCGRTDTVEPVPSRRNVAGAVFDRDPLLALE